MVVFRESYPTCAPVCCGCICPFSDAGSGICALVESRLSVGCIPVCITRSQGPALKGILVGCSATAGCRDSRKPLVSARGALAAA